MTNKEKYISLRDYFEKRLILLEKQTDSNATQLEKNLNSTAYQLEKRLDSMNEFRGQLKDQADTLLPRNEYYVQHERIVEDIKSLRESRSELAGKASQAAVIYAYILAILSFLIGVVSIIIHLIH